MGSWTIAAVEFWLCSEPDDAVVSEEERVLRLVGGEAGHIGDG